MKKFITNRYTLTFIGVVLFFILWYLIYVIVGQNIYVFPGPLTTIKRSFELFGDAYLYKCIWGSLYRMVIGFASASILAIIIGMIVGNHIKLKHVFNPTMIALRSIPTAAIVFLLLHLAGFNNAAPYVVGVIVFPMVYEATVSGYQNIDQKVLMAMRIDGNNHLQQNFKVKLPLSMPYIAVGLTTSFALSFKIEIMAETLTSTSKSYGLGRAIAVSFANQTDGLISTFAYAFVAILIMMIVSLIIWIIKKALHIKNPSVQ